MPLDKLLELVSAVRFTVLPSSVHIDYIESYVFLASSTLSGSPIAFRLVKIACTYG